MRDKLAQLLEEAEGQVNNDYPSLEQMADYLIEHGVIVTPCVAYNKKHEKYQTIHRGKQGHIFASKLYHVRSQAEKALAERKGGAE